ncbi:MAG: efflux RND transporter periplasmic adaptor subunit [Polyangiaceae bacterium]
MSSAESVDEVSESNPHLDAVTALERELSARRRGRVWKLGAALLLLAGAGFGIRAYLQRKAPIPPPPFVTVAVALRDIVESVESNGKVKPLTEVKVGTQVSGRVVNVYVDFNSQVKRGDLLAEIDPSLFKAQFGQVSGQLGHAEADLDRARATERAARVHLDRTRQLRADSLAPQADLERAESNVQIAGADVLAAQAQIKGLKSQLASAGTTLAYTKIYSPIDGIVIDRAVDPGQTVASSFSAPVLFVIARDLSAMQALADIDEADVGKLKEGMPASVRVDAFQDDSFAGRVTQIRFSPTEVQGVVTYAAVVEVKNDQLKLRPGMTATVTIKTASVKGVKAVRNAALRFKPKDPAQAAPNVEFAPGQRRLYLLEGDAKGEAKPKLLPTLVQVGISDGMWTELKSEQPALDRHVVSEERAASKERTKFLGVF